PDHHGANASLGKIVPLCPAHALGDKVSLTMSQPEGAWQLRRYKIREGSMDAWLEEWSRHIRPLRERLGFRVVGAWTAGATEFIWILGYDGPLSWTEADLAYYASPERKAIDPNPARHIEAAEEVMISPVGPPSS